MISWCALAGCEGFQKKHDNPVMVQAPLRVENPEGAQDSESEEYVQNSSKAKSKKKSADDSNQREVAKKDASKADQAKGSKDNPGAEREIEMASKEFDGSEIKQTSATPPKNPWENWKDDTAIFNAQVAATVNGVAILNGDVLDHHAGYLMALREELQKVSKNPKPGQPVPTPNDYEKLRYSIIQQQIGSYIQKKLLVERLKSGLKPEQVKLMDEHIDEMFEKEIDKLKREMKVTNKTELEIALNKRGTTLANVKANFALDKLSMECVGLKSEKPATIERPDLVAYYQSHPDKFTFEAKVRWQQVAVTLSPEVSKRVARKKLEQAAAELKSGTPFEKVAKKYSDGPTAKQGGTWDWMEAGNLKDKTLEKKLFTMPLNQLSEIYEGEDSFSIVKVLDRQEAGRKPFQDVQQEIHTILEDEQNRKRPKKLFRDLYSRAVIETQYSIPQFGGDE